MMKDARASGGQAVGNMLYGMQSMSSDVQVCVLLSDFLHCWAAGW
jgi:hypothetical protein